MRLKIKIVPQEDFVYSEINNYLTHSMIWDLLKDTEFEKLHDIKKFKFFTFSEIQRPTSFLEGREKWFYISSPNKYLIEILYKKISEKETIKLGKHVLNVYTTKPFNMSFSKVWKSGSVIILQVSRNRYWSKKYDSLDIFLKRLKENALKKHNIFFNDKLDFEGPIFDRLSLEKQVAIHIRKNKKDIRLIGTKWTFWKDNIEKDLRKFYKFIFDCGLGEKNSMGFGFII